MRLLLLILLTSSALVTGCQSRSSASTSRTAGAIPVGTQEAATAEAPTTPPSANADTLAQAYKTLLGRLVLPAQPADLASAAWSGAVAEARREGVTAAPGPPFLGADATDDLTAFQSAFGSLLSSGSGKLDAGKLERSALTSMAESVNDCHTAYLTRDQWQSIDADLRGLESLDGLPLTFQLQNPYLIESVVSGSNADQQGVRPGDRIVTFDGVTLDQVPLSQRKFLSAGSAGSTVRLEIESSQGNRRTVSVRREAVDRPVLTTRVVGDVAYVRLRTFVFNLNQMLDPTLSSLLAQGVRGFVLDLRGNLGGELNSDVHLLSQFIPAGLIATSTDRRGRADEVRVDGSLLPGPPPLAVLVDGGSLSASELFAEAIEQYRAGEIVGTRTPGCLLGSTFQPLPDGSAIQVSSVEVRVGVRNTIVNNVGVEPDVMVPITAADFTSGRDPQLDRALTDVQGMLTP